MPRLPLALLVAFPLAAQDVRPAQLDHVHLTTRDAKTARDYYAKHFLPGPLKFHESAHAPATGLISAIWHIGWGAADVQAEYRRQTDLGAKYSTPPTNLAEAGPKFLYSYVEGPDQAMIELNTAADAEFRHIHLLAEDPIATAEWYMKYFGFPTMGNRPLSRRSVHLGGVEVGPTANLAIGKIYLGIFPAAWARKEYPKDWKDTPELVTTAGRVIDHIAFRVDDFDGTLARMRAAGVPILMLPRRQGDEGQQVYIEGPDKIVIELVK